MCSTPFETVKACTKYIIDGKEVTVSHSSIEENLVPVYAELPGWKTDRPK